MTHDEARAAWEEAKKATQRARKALQRARQKVREAESHFNKCWDTERSAFVAVENHKYPSHEGK